MTCGCDVSSRNRCHHSENGCHTLCGEKSNCRSSHLLPWTETVASPSGPSWWQRGHVFFRSALVEPTLMWPPSHPFSGHTSTNNQPLAHRQSSSSTTMVAAALPLLVSRPTVEGLCALVHGHWPVEEVVPTVNRWNIDTGAGFARLNRLIFLEVNSQVLRSWTFDADEFRVPGSAERIRLPPPDLRRRHAAPAR